MVEIKQWFNWYRSKGPRYTGSTLIWKLLTVPKLTQCYLLLIINYHAISIERLPSKTKIGNFSWYFNNSLLCKPDFSSATKNLLSLLKTQKSNHSSASNRWKYTKSCSKENGRTFSKNSTNQGNIRISRLKKSLRNLYKKENFTPEINQLSKIYKMNFIN